MRGEEMHLANASWVALEATSPTAFWSLLYARGAWFSGKVASRHTSFHRPSLKHPRWSQIRIPVVAAPRICRIPKRPHAARSRRFFCPSHSSLRRRRPHLRRCSSSQMPAARPRWLRGCTVPPQASDESREGANRISIPASCLKNGAPYPSRRRGTNARDADSLRFQGRPSRTGARTPGGHMSLRLRQSCLLPAVILIAMLICGASRAAAQNVFAAVHGTVTDTTGAVVSHAQEI